MTQPEYVPISGGDRVRGAERLPPARRWAADRPAETARARLPRGDSFGSVGPDQGYGLSLARRFERRLQLTSGEHGADAIAGCAAVAIRRSALYGRAPVIFDAEHAFGLWGFLDDAPGELVEFRRPLFSEAAHHYWARRDLVDRVPEDTLRLSPDEVRARLTDWRNLLRTHVPAR